MASTIDSLARAVRDALNNAPDGTFSGTFANWMVERPAVCKHVPVYDRTEIEQLRVICSSDPEFSHAFNEDLQDRCCDSPLDYTVFVCIAKAIEKVDDDAVDAGEYSEVEDLKQFAEDVAKFVFWQDPFTIKGERMTCKGMEFGGLYDRDELMNSRVFKSLLSFTYA